MAGDSELAARLSQLAGSNPTLYRQMPGASVAAAASGPDFARTAAQIDSLREALFTARNLRRYDTDHQYSMWADLDRGMQERLQAVGYEVPHRSDPGFFETFIGRPLGYVVGGTIGNVVEFANKAAGGLVGNIQHWHRAAEFLNLEAAERETGNPFDKGAYFRPIRAVFTSPEAWSRAWEQTKDGDNYIPFPEDRLRDAGVGVPRQVLTVALDAAREFSEAELTAIYGEQALEAFEHPEYQRAVDVLTDSKLSIGRSVAGNMGIDPGDAAFDKVSGIADGSVLWFADPFNLVPVGKIRLAREGLLIARNADTVRAAARSLPKVQRGVQRITDIFSVAERSDDGLALVAGQLVTEMPRLTPLVDDLIKADPQSYDDVVEFFAQQAGTTALMRGEAPKLLSLQDVSLSRLQGVWNAAGRDGMETFIKGMEAIPGGERVTSPFKRLARRTPKGRSFDPESPEALEFVKAVGEMGLGKDRVRDVLDAWGAASLGGKRKIYLGMVKELSEAIAGPNGQRIPAIKRYLDTMTESLEKLDDVGRRYGDSLSGQELGRIVRADGSTEAYGLLDFQVLNTRWAVPDYRQMANSMKALSRLHESGKGGWIPDGWVNTFMDTIWRPGKVLTMSQGFRQGAEEVLGYALERGWMATFKARLSATATRRVAKRKDRAFVEQLALRAKLGTKGVVGDLDAVDASADLMDLFGWRMLSDYIDPHQREIMDTRRTLMTTITRNGKPQRFAVKPSGLYQEYSQGAELQHIAWQSRLQDLNKSEQARVALRAFLDGGPLEREILATGEELLHGTSRAFEGFGPATNRFGRSIRGDRFYFTDKAEVAERFSEAGGFKQVSVDHFLGEAIDEFEDEVGELLRFRQSLQRQTDKGHRIRYTDELGEVHWVDSAADVPDSILRESSDLDVRLYPPGVEPRVRREMVFGKTLDLRDPSKIPDDLRVRLEREGRYRPWEATARGAWDHEHSDELIAYAREHGFGKIRVLDGSESGGESIIALAEFIGEANVLGRAGAAERAMEAYLRSDDAKKLRQASGFFQELRSTVGDHEAYRRWAAESVEMVRSLTHSPEGLAHKSLIGKLLRGNVPEIETLLDIPLDARPLVVSAREIVPLGASDSLLETIYEHGFELVDKQMRWVSREPMMVGEYSRVKKLLRKDLERLAATGIKDADEIGKRWVADIAAREVYKHVDDPRLRTQFAEAHRALFPFWYAQDLFIRRWGKRLLKDPGVARRAQLSLNGVEHSGFTERDESGELVFHFPAAGIVMAGLTKGLGAITGNNVYNSVHVGFSGKVKYLAPGFGEGATGFVRPGVGPIVTIATSALHSRFPEIIEPIQGVVEGDFSNSPVWRQLAPTAFTKIFSAFDEEQRTSLVLQAVQQIEASGHGLPEDADAATREQYLDRVRSAATALGVVRGVFGFTAPGGPKLEFAGDLQPELVDFLKVMPPEEAFAAFLRKNPDASAYTVFKSELVQGARKPLDPTATAGEFWAQNKGFFDKYGAAATWFLPDSPEGFDPVVYREQLASGLRQQKSPEDFWMELKRAAAAPEYYRRRDEYIAATENLVGPAREFKDAEWAQWKTLYLAQHPALEQHLLQGAVRTSVRQQTLSALAQALEDPAVPKASHFAEMKAIVDRWSEYRLQSDSLRGRRDFAARLLRKQLDQDMLAFGAGLQMPVARSLFDANIRPDLNDEV